MPSISGHGGASPVGTLLWAAALGLVAAMGAHAAGAPAPLTAAERPPVVFAPEWDALIGRWLGQGEAGAANGTAPGPRELAGAASFGYELDGRVMTRRNVADYPPANGRAGRHHEDLMTIYPAPDGRNAEAMYYDNEGHVIHYAATWASDGRSLVMLSFPAEGEPRYRLTWRFVGFDRLVLTFDVAPPGSVEFASYAGGLMRRAGH
jgi:hypothetical protein